MRHRMRKNSSFGRHRGPRKALIRGLVNSLVEKERIKITVPKAKCIRPLIEKAVTMGKRGDVHSRRLLFARYPNKKTVDKIMTTLSPRFKDRQGGYTRIIKLGFRSGDQAPLAYLEFVDYNMPAATQKDTLDKKRKKEDKKGAGTEAKKQKKSPTKSSLVKSTDSKRQKKQMIAKGDKKAKKARLKQKKSRRVNRSI